jgi:hypothetical protein
MKSPSKALLAIVGAALLVAVPSTSSAQTTIYPIPYVDADPNVPEIKPEKLGNIVWKPDSVTLEAALRPACGEAHHDTPCDKACVQLFVTLSNKPACGKICIDIPSNKKPKSVTLMARNLDQNFWSDCGGQGKPGDCKIGWTRYEKTEYYIDRNRVCVIVKNWSHNLERGYKVGIELADKK